MKAFTLVKHHSCVQLGHLYEHIFAASVKSTMQNSSCYKYLDYALQGTTHDNSGIIEIECEFYTDKAAQLSHAISTISADINPDSIAIALRQILAEEKRLLYVDNKEAIMSGLQELETTPWKIAESIDSIDTKTFRSNKDPLYLTPEIIPTGQIIASVKLDKRATQHNRTLLPLFTTISKIILLHFGDVTTARYGYYGIELKASARHKTPQVNGYYRCLARDKDTIDSPALLSLLEKSVNEFYKPETIKRFIERMQSISYETRSAEYDSAGHLLDETGIYLGAKGWKHITNPANIAMIRENLSLDIAIK